MEKYFNIDLNSLKKIKVSTNTRGVYFLYDQKELVYIGQSKHMIHRIYDHINQKTKQFDSYKLINVSKKDNLTMIEDFYIRKHKPKYNKANAIEIPYKKSIKRPQVLKYSNYYKSPKITINILNENIS